MDRFKDTLMTESYGYLERERERLGTSTHIPTVILCKTVGSLEAESERVRARERLSTSRHIPTCMTVGSLETAAAPVKRGPTVR